MYSSVSDAEYQFRRKKAEGEARNAYAKASSPKSDAVPSPSFGGRRSRLSDLLSGLREDDLLLVGILFLLFNESKGDDPLILILLAALFFC